MPYMYLYWIQYSSNYNRVLMYQRLVIRTTQWVLQLQPIIVRFPNLQNTLHLTILGENFVNYRHMFKLTSDDLTLTKQIIIIITHLYNYDIILPSLFFLDGIIIFLRNVEFVFCKWSQTAIFVQYEIYLEFILNVSRIQ